MYPFSHHAFLLLGANQGEKKVVIEKAICLISSEDTQIVTRSTYYFSQSWGYDDANYLNIAIEVRTQLSPEQLLEATQAIEKELGRTTKTTNHYEARPIDIDILFYDNWILKSTELTIPHPRLHLRNFVLQPLKEIATNFVHPVLQRTISELAVNCTDKGKVWKA